MLSSSTRRGAALRAVLVAATALGAACERPAETPAPRLTALAPSRVQSGQAVVLQGTGFAAEPALNAVYFGNARARVDAASTTELRVQVPDLPIASAEPARVAVRVVVASRESDSLEVDVLPGAFAALPGEDPLPGEPVVAAPADTPAETPGLGSPPLRQASAAPAPTPAPPLPPSTPAANPPPKPRPTPTPAPLTPEPAPKGAAGPTPPPPPPPDPDLERAQQAFQEGDPETALELFESVLERSPDDADAVAGRDRARAAIQERRVLVTGETRVTAAPGSGSSAPAGFASDDVELGAEAPPARISFEIRPDRVQPGAPWRVAIFLANDSDDRLTVASLSAEIRENGKRRAMAPASRAARVNGGGREQVGELAGSWGSDPESWSLEVTVLSDEGDRYVCRLTWR